MTKVLYGGGCHCGALRFTYASAEPLAPRSCDCSFCRKHATRMVSDPGGEVILRCDGAQPIRYRFALGTADFLTCSVCGVYVGVMITVDASIYSTLDLNVFDDPRPDLPGRSVAYGSEDVTARIGRRETVWTPTKLEGLAAPI